MGEKTSINSANVLLSWPVPGEMTDEQKAAAKKTHEVSGEMDRIAQHMRDDLKNFVVKYITAHNAQPNEASYEAMDDGEFQRVQSLVIEKSFDDEKYLYKDALAFFSTVAGLAEIIINANRKFYAETCVRRDELLGLQQIWEDGKKVLLSTGPDKAIKFNFVKQGLYKLVEQYPRVNELTDMVIDILPARKSGEIVKQHAKQAQPLPHARKIKIPKYLNWFLGGALAATIAHGVVGPRERPFSEEYGSVQKKESQTRAQKFKNEYLVFFLSSEIKSLTYEWGVLKFEIDGQPEEVFKKMFKSRFFAIYNRVGEEKEILPRYVLFKKDFLDVAINKAEIVVEETTTSLQRPVTSAVYFNKLDQFTSKLDAYVRMDLPIEVSKKKNRHHYQKK